MGNFSIWHWIIVLVVVGIPVLLLTGALRAGVARPGEVANTWKFRTVVFTILAVVVPFWLITLPLFLFLAYRSYKAGEAAAREPFKSLGTEEFPQINAQAPGQSKAEQLTALHELLKSGALTQEECDAEKKKVLAA